MTFDWKLLTDTILLFQTLMNALETPNANMDAKTQKALTDVTVLKDTRAITSTTNALVRTATVLLCFS